MEPEHNLHLMLCVIKRLDIKFSYGGQRRDLEEALNLIARGEITPHVEEGRLEDFPRWLKDLSDGKVKARVALTSV